MFGLMTLDAGAIGQTFSVEVHRNGFFQQAVPGMMVYILSDEKNESGHWFCSFSFSSLFV